MNDSALRDIIPYGDTESLKTIRREKCSRICQIGLFTIFLGFVAVGIVAVVANLGYWFLQYSIKPSEMHKSSPLLGETQPNISHQQYSTRTSSEQILNRTTSTAVNNNEFNDITPSSTVKPDQQTQYIPTNRITIELHVSTDKMINKQVTSESVRNEMKILDKELIIEPSKRIKNQEYNDTSQKMITIDNSPTSMFSISTNDDITTSETVLLSTSMDLQSSTNQREGKTD